MQKKIPELSLFIPFWNEEENIEKVITDAVKIVRNIAVKWEIIMIDDGSDDQTFKIAKKLEKTFSPDLKTIQHFPNRGYGSALKEGFKYSKYKIVAFIDGDGQFDVSEINKFLEIIDICDIVIGKRKKRKDNFTRHLLMNFLKVWDFILFNFNYADIDCGFKVFKKSAILKILPLKSEGAMITTEILAKAKKNNLVIMQVSVNHYARKYGNQSGGDLRVIARAIKESFILWFDLWKN